MKEALPRVTILTSAVGLGVYIPALLIQRQLRLQQCMAETEVLEDYFTPARQQAHLEHKEAHHDNFALAQLGHRMVRDVQDCLDGDRVQMLLQHWMWESRRHFIVWSGFWLPVLESYRRLIGRDRLHVDHCRIDAEISASFKIYPDLKPESEIWLWNWQAKKIVHEIPVTDAPVVPFGERRDSLVVHGGGWGIGTHRSRLFELEQSGFSLDIVIHNRNEATPAGPDSRFFMMDPDWHPWIRNAEGDHMFPSIGVVEDALEIEYRPNETCHELYNVIRQSKAIVSKPGGCTLIDSLSSATPVVLLEHYGYAEQSNARIWEHLGYGVAYADWQRTGYDPAVLESLHSNIISRAPRGTNYPRAYANSLRAMLR